MPLCHALLRVWGAWPPFHVWAQNHLIHLFIFAWLRCKMINQMKAHPLHHRSGWAAHCSRTRIQTRAHTQLLGGSCSPLNKGVLICVLQGTKEPGLPQNHSRGEDRRSAQKPPSLKLQPGNHCGSACSHRRTHTYSGQPTHSIGCRQATALAGAPRAFTVTLPGEMRTRP